MGRVVSVYMWWCGDDYCDCAMPVVEVRSEEEFRDPNWKPVERIVEGPFLSRGCGAAEPEEIKAQKKWLRDAERWYKVRHKCSQCGHAPSSTEGKEK